MCGGLHTHTPTLRSETHTGYPATPLPCFILLSQVFSLNLGARLITSTGILLFLLATVLGTQAQTTTPPLYVGTEGWNSGPQTHTQALLPTGSQIQNYSKDSSCFK